MEKEVMSGEKEELWSEARAKEHELFLEKEGDSVRLADQLEAVGADELAAFLRAHEQDPLRLSGESPFPKTSVELLNDLYKVNLDAGDEFFSEVVDGSIPGGDVRVVGAISEAAKRGVQHRRRLYTHDAAIALQENERPMQSGERIRAERSLHYVNQLREQHGLPPVEMSIDQIHAIESECVDGDYAGMHTSHEGSIVKAETPTSVVDLELTSHELLHLGSYAALQGEYTDRGVSFVSYRIGLKIVSRTKDEKGQRKAYLEGLNEAMTEELAKRFVTGIREDDPELGEWAANRVHNIDLFYKLHGEEANKRGEDREDILDVIETETGVRPIRFTYAKERELLSRIVSEIANSLPEKDAEGAQRDTEAKVFEEIAKGYFTGNIIPFAKLFTARFGPETFRTFARIESTTEQHAYLDSLLK